MHVLELLASTDIQNGTQEQKQGSEKPERLQVHND
jgi:hypothetical protein